MRKVLILLAALAFVAAGDWSDNNPRAAMPLTIGAGSMGYGATAQDEGQHFTNFWAGLRGYQASEKTAVYGCYQHVGMDVGTNGDGAKMLLISGTPKIPWFYLIADIGVAWDLAQNADGTTAAAFTSGGGVAVAMTEYISPFVYASAYDSGPRFSWSIHFGLAVTDIQAMVTKK